MPLIGKSQHFLLLFDGPFVLCYDDRCPRKDCVYERFGTIRCPLCADTTRRRAPPNQRVFGFRRNRLIEHKALFTRSPETAFGRHTNVDLEQTWADHLMHLELLAILQAKTISSGRRERLWCAPSDSLDDRIPSPGAS